MRQNAWTASHAAPPTGEFRKLSIRTTMSPQSPRELMGPGAHTILRQRIWSAGARADAAIAEVQMNVDLIAPYEINGVACAILAEVHETLGPRTIDTAEPVLR